MKHFDRILCNEDVFYLKPKSYSIDSPKEVLERSIGALLYTSALRENLMQTLLNLRVQNCNSVAICLEDATNSRDIKKAEKNLFKLLENIKVLMKADDNFLDKLPLIFIRVKNRIQMEYILKNFSTDSVCGIIIPKITSENAKGYISKVEQFNKERGRKIYCLPVLESREIAFKESRLEELMRLKNIFDGYKENILNVRIGATDISGIFGLRRGRNSTVYNVAVVRECISDIINVFSRDGYVVSGAVYEYFNRECLKQPAALYREIEEDICNGIKGKTAIHPVQVLSINAWHVVSKEEYMDAIDIMESDSDGVLSSAYRNKMNEIKPHLKWAENTIKTAEVMGVYNNGKNAENLFKAYDRMQEGSIGNKA